MKKVIFILLIILVVFLSLIPRSTEVLNKNYIFGFDQGRDYLAVRDIVVNHKPTLIGSEWGAGSAGFSGLFHGPFYYYFLAVPFVILNGDPYGGVVLMFLLGMLTVGFSYFFAYKVFGKFFGIITALFVAISPPLITQSRFSWNSYPASLFILLTFFFIYRILEKRKDSKNFFLAAFFSGFIYNFQTAIAIPMSITLFIILILQKVRSIRFYILSILGFALAFSPIILFQTRHDFMGIKGIIAYMFMEKKTEVTLKFMEFLLKDHFGTFTYNFLDTFPHQNIIPPIIIFLIIFLPATYFMFKEKNSPLKKFILYLLISPFVSFLVFAFLKNSVYPHYLINLNFVYIFLISYALYSAYKRKNNIVKVLLSIFLVINTVYAVSIAIKTFKYDYNDYGGNAKIKGKIDAIDYIYKDANGKQFGLFVFSPPIYTYPYEYIVDWYAERKYNYRPHQEKKGLFYLLIEVDTSKPWSYKGWMETVIKTGKILETKKLPSGFIVQKRIQEN